VPRKLEVVITGDTAGLERALTRSSSAATTFAGRMEKTGRSMTSFGKTLTKSVTLPIVGVGVVITKMALDSEASMAKFNAAVKSSGLSVKGMDKSLQGAEQRGRALGFTNIELQGGLARLVVATQSSTKSVRDLAVAEDLARFKHISLEQSSQMLSQAMTGSARAVKQLGINVIPVTTAMDALKAAHKKTGDAATEQEKVTAKLADKLATGNQVIAEVTQRLHGQAAAYASTAAGGMAQFRAQIENIGEKLGSALLPMLNRVVDALTRALNWFNQLSPATKKWIGILATVAAAVGPILIVFGKLFSAIGQVSGALKLMVLNPELAAAMVILAGAAYILGRAFINVENQVANANSKFRDMLATIRDLKNLTPNITTAQRELSNQEIALGNTQDSLAQKTRAWHEVLAAGTQKTRVGAQAWRDYKQAQNDVATAQDAVKSAGAAVDAAQDKHEQTTTRLKSKLDGLNASYGKLLSNFGPLGQGTQSISGTFDAFARTVAHPIAAVEGLKRNLDFGSNIGRSEQQLGRISTAARNMAQSLRESDPKAALSAITLARLAAAASNLEIRYNKSASLIGSKKIVAEAKLLGKEGFLANLESLVRSNITAGQRAHSGFLAGAGKVVADAGKSISGVVSTVAASVGKVAGAARSVGVSIGMSLAGGISSTVGAVQAAAAQVAAAAEVAIRARAQVHSVSPLFKGIGADMMTSVGVGIQSVTNSVASTMGNAVITIIEGAIRAAKIALAKAKTDLASSMSSFTSAAAGAFDTAGGGSPKTRALAKKLKAEQDAQKAQQDAAAAAQRQQALASAQAQLQADTSAGPTSGETPEDYQKRLAADQQAIDDAAKAIADAKVQAQIDANAATLAERQKADKDDFEKQLAGLERQAAGAKTEAQVKAIRAKINALFKKYGITPGTVEAGSDWNASQTLFVGAMGDLNKSMQELISAINNLTGASSALPSTSAGSMPHHAEGGKTKAGLAMLHNGEYVLKSSATRKIGLPALNHLNWFGHFQDGGPVLPKLGKNPKLNLTTGLPDVPEYRAAAMYLNDYGADRNETPIGTALAGLLGPGAQARAAIRATRVGGVSLRRGLWRASGGIVDSKMLDAWKKNYPGITFEPGTPGQQISWMQAASRLPQGGQELGGLIASSLGGSGTGANTHGSLVEQLTSHAVHFARGGVALADGLAMLHKNETVIPARGGMPIQLHTTVELDGRVVGRSVQNYLGEQTRWGSPGLPR
jgi:phage FluMu protein gp41